MEPNTNNPLEAKDIETTLRVLTDYVFWEGHGDTMFDEPVVEVMEALRHNLELLKQRDSQ